MEINIADNIRNLRKKQCLTQEQLAEALGVTVGAVYKWEASLSVPEIKLIVELANFFEVSVDTLLGYEQQTGNIKKYIQKMQTYIAEKDFEKGASESEKTLQKYPNSFDVVYVSALLYMFKFAEDKCKHSMLKSNQLFEKAIHLLYQNKDKNISEVTILNYIASNYLSAGEAEQALTILKENNICGINSNLIGYTYAVELKKTKEAEHYLVPAMFDTINQMVRTLSGWAFVYAQKQDKGCIAIAERMIGIFDSMRKDEQAITFFDKLKAVALAQCGVWSAAFLNAQTSKEYTKKAYELAKKFDASPIYTMKGIEFLSDIETESIFHDVLGKTAMEAVENFVFAKEEKSETFKWTKARWEELKNGYSDT